MLILTPVFAVYMGASALSPVSSTPWTAAMVRVTLLLPPPLADAPLLPPLHAASTTALAANTARAFIRCINEILLLCYSRHSWVPSRSSARNHLGRHLLLPARVDLRNPDRSSFPERARGCFRNPHGLQPIARGAPALPAARRELHEGKQLGAIGRREAIQEALPSWFHGDSVRVEGQDGRVRSESDRHSVARPDQLHADVVAAWVVAPPREHRERAAAQPHDGDNRVHIVVAREHLEAQCGSLNVDRVDLITRHESNRIEIRSEERRVGKEYRSRDQASTKHER